MMMALKWPSGKSETLINPCLPKHIEEIRVTLAEIYLDILTVNETRLDNNIANQSMFIHNYDLIMANHSRTGGGICLYV